MYNVASTEYMSLIIIFFRFLCRKFFNGMGYVLIDFYLNLK